MLGGALRGFNLLLVLAGLLVGTLVMQWRWSRRSVESIGVRRRLSPEAFAGDAVSSPLPADESEPIRARMDDPRRR